MKVLGSHGFSIFQPKMLQQYSFTKASDIDSHHQTHPSKATLETLPPGYPAATWAQLKMDDISHQQLINITWRQELLGIFFWFFCGSTSDDDDDDDDDENKYECDDDNKSVCY